jgi:hypothetical protein
MLRRRTSRGDALVELNGQLYELDIGAWTKQTERAGKFLSLSIKLKGDRSNQQRFNGDRQPRAQDLDGVELDALPRRQPGADDDIPF